VVGKTGILDILVGSRPLRLLIDFSFLVSKSNISGCVLAISSGTRHSPETSCIYCRWINTLPVFYDALFHHVLVSCRNCLMALVLWCLFSLYLWTCWWNHYVNDFVPQDGCATQSAKIVRLLQSIIGISLLVLWIYRKIVLLNFYTYNRYSGWALFI